MGGPSRPTERIPLEAVKYPALSSSDPNGRVFHWNGRLFRGINPDHADRYRDLFERGIIQLLVERGLLVDSGITSLELEGFGLVIEHRELPFVSYPFEWPAVMLRDAGLLVADLQLELLNHDLTLTDGHPWNVLFDGPHPVHVDVTSIAPNASGSGWPSRSEFDRSFVNPLLLMAAGHGRLARALLRDHWGVLAEEVAALSPRSFGVSSLLRPSPSVVDLARRRLPSPLRKAARGARRSFGTATRPTLSPRDAQQSVEWSKRRIEAIPPLSRATEWSEYYGDDFPPFVPSREWSAKQVNVHRVLKEERPPTVLEIGCNRGWYSQLAASLGSKVVAFDTDENALAQLYHDARRADLWILPLAIDFRNPSPAYGVYNHEIPSAVARLRCDTVLALALVHHLVFKQRMTFSEIVDGLSGFTERTLLVEFVPGEDRFVREWQPERLPWYTLEEFCRALRQRFTKVTLLPSDPEPRVFCLCKR